MKPIPKVSKNLAALMAPWENISPNSAIRDAAGIVCEKLRAIITDAETLEALADEAKLAAENEALKSELQVLKTNHASEVEFVHTEIAATQKALDALRKEKAHREKNEDELPDEQFRILKVLPSEEGGRWKTVSEISKALRIAPDEVEIHLDRLKADGLATDRFNPMDAHVWHRAMSGNKYVLAKRLAGEEDEDTEQTYDGLPPGAVQILLLIAEGLRSTIPELASRIGKTEGFVESLVNLMGSKDLVSFDHSDGNPRAYITNPGTELLIRAGRLQ